jgi:hypothetical protein
MSRLKDFKVALTLGPGSTQGVEPLLAILNGAVARRLQ